MDELVAFYKGWVRPDEDSGSLRFASILRILETNCVADLQMSWVDVAAADSPRRLETLRNFFHGHILPDEWRGAQSALHKRPYTFCWITFWDEAARIAPLVRKIVPWAPVVIDTVDVHFIREESAARLGLMDPMVAAENKRRELAVYQAADAVVVVSEEEVRTLRSAGITTPVYIIPNIVPDRPRSKRVRERELLFIGGFAHKPNVDGITWFVHECWPKVRAAVPAAKLTVVGSQATAEVLALAEEAGVEVVGYVAETAPYLDRAAVSVAPLRFGGGLKGKVCEAMAAGLPVVTTTYGVQGLEVRDGGGLRVQDDAAGFADAVIWALTNVEAAEAMGARGKQMIANVCGPEIVARKTLEMVGALRKTPTLVQRAAWVCRRLAFYGLVRTHQTLQILRAVRLYKHSKSATSIVTW